MNASQAMEIAREALGRAHTSPERRSSFELPDGTFADDREAPFSTVYRDPEVREVSIGPGSCPGMVRYVIRLWDAPEPAARER